MKPPLLLAAISAVLLAGCVSSGPGPGPRQVTRTEIIFGADDYDYYPGYEVYYSRAHNYYYYREGRAWVRRPQPPRVWVREAPSVQVHFSDAPDRHHAEIVRQYPKAWRPAPRVSPANIRAERDRRGDKRDDHDDRDHDRGRDDHDRDRK